MELSQDLLLVKNILDNLLKRLREDVAPAFYQDPDYGNARLLSWNKSVEKQLTNEVYLPLLVSKLHIFSSMQRFMYTAGETDSDHFFEYVKNKIESGINSLLLDIDNGDFDMNDYVELSKSEAKKSEIINLKNRKCFIVHGRDDVFKLEVARHLEKKGFEAIILHEQPSGGRTVIEKLVKYAKECEFAIVLYTPDDEGRLVDSGIDIQKRARQNVVFEHGLTIGLMGKHRVFPLVSEHNIEKPNDISGIVYIPKDNWKSDLDMEIKDLGYTL